MSYITIADAETSLSIDDGEVAIFNNVISIEYNNPKTLKLIDSPQGNSDGLAYEENLTQSPTVTVLVREVPSDLYEDLLNVWETRRTKKRRLNLSVIDLTTGCSLSLTKGILTADPANRKAEESESSLDVTLTMQATERNIQNSIKELE